jgi:hypothetical protein
VKIFSQLFLIINFSFSIYNSSSAQSPLVKMWDKRFGGLGIDQLTCIEKTKDGGVLLGGISLSGIGGNKTQSVHGAVGSDVDYWIIKIDSMGSKIWDKDFGGVGYDYLTSIDQTADGGYIIGGYSSSGISGDKTETSWGGLYGYDYWIIKIDSFGFIQWDKDFGGTEDDELRDVQQTPDGGYIIGGLSSSGIGGDKSQATWGSSDYWVIKTDSLGNKQWDKDFGGSDHDYFYSLVKSSDGGYVFGGSSYSDSSGNKTNNNWGAGFSVDYWIVKTDSVGTIEWDKDYGGQGSDGYFFFCLEKTNDNGILVGGSSNSSVGGNKTQPLWGGGDDFWILKIDSIGNILWDKDYGGTDSEELFSIGITSDNGIIFGGDSYSTISGNKTENNYGSEQSWMLKTDSIGNILWDKTIFAPGHDESSFVIETGNNCYLVANWNLGSSGIGGYKTEMCWNGSSDFWIVKFCDSTFFPPTASFTSPQLICPGTCINFINHSSHAAIYQWYFSGAYPDSSTVDNPINICYPIPGTYSVTLIASNANGSDTLTLQNYITVFPQPPAQSISQSADTLFAINGSSTYQWFFNGNIIPSATDYFYVASSSGDYNVVATDANGCEVEAVINNVLASVQLAVHSEQLAIFPNPVVESLSIVGFSLSEKVDKISIYNVFGEVMFLAVIPIAIGSELPTVNCQLFSSGIYYLEITAHEKTYRAKFVKQ